MFTIPAGLKEVDLGVGAVPIEEEQSPQAIGSILSIRVKAIDQPGFDKETVDPAQL